MWNVAAEQLLHQCAKARAAGGDFPTIWHSVLKSHPLVTGLPTQDVRDGEALIVVHLWTGQRLACSTQGFRFI